MSEPMIVAAKDSKVTRETISGLGTIIRYDGPIPPRVIWLRSRFRKFWRRAK